MKYWGYLAAKLAVAAGLLYPLALLIERTWPKTKPYDQGGPMPALNDLPYAFAMLSLALFGAGVVWAIVWDQRYRCRTCLRRLRMPVLRGNWTHVLLGAPRTEYICPYGHGTMTVDELQLTGPPNRDWQPHEDMWKELFSLEETKK
jgi:hypothetical protein